MTLLHRSLIVPLPVAEAFDLPLLLWFRLAAGTRGADTGRPEFPWR